MAATILAVSIDSFFAGFSAKNKTVLFPLLVGAITLAMCFITMYLGKWMSTFLPNLKYIGCAILALIGIFNILKKSGGERETKWLGVALAAGVATDAALAAFSFALLGYTGVWIVAGIALAHFLCSWLGVMISKKIASARYFNIISGIVLIALAAVKIFA